MILYINACIQAISHKFSIEDGVQVVRDATLAVLHYPYKLYHPWPRVFNYQIDGGFLDNTGIIPYKTLFHNKNHVGTLGLFYLTSQQINLLSHMWTHAMVQEGGSILQDILAK